MCGEAILDRSVPLSYAIGPPLMLEEFISRNILWRIFLRLPPGRQKPRSLRAPRVPFPVEDPTNQRSANACSANQEPRSRTDLFRPESAIKVRLAVERTRSVQHLDETTLQEDARTLAAYSLPSGQKYLQHAAYTDSPRAGVGKGSFLLV